MFQKFSAVFIAKLANDTLGDLYVKDDSKEIFWTVWEDENKNVELLTYSL